MPNKRKSLHQINNKNMKKTKTANQNWDNLPSDVMIIIFLHLNTFDLLCNAQFVSSYWRKITKDPQFYRDSIIIPDKFRQRFVFKDSNYLEKFTEFAIEAVNRSNGELRKIYIGSDVTSKLLRHIINVNKSNSLRYLGLPKCGNVSSDDYLLMELAERNRLLEEVKLGRTDNSKEVIKKFGSCCLKLKFFSFNYGECCQDEALMKESDVAKVIAKCMSKILGLSFSGGGVTDDGLRMIRERCTQLEYLDLGECSLGMVKNTSVNKCFNFIQVVKLPSSGYDTTSSCFGTDYYNVEDVKLPSSSCDITSPCVGSDESDLAWPIHSG